MNNNKNLLMSAALLSGMLGACSVNHKVSGETRVTYGIDISNLEEYFLEACAAQLPDDATEDEVEQCVAESIDEFLDLLKK